jgi:hypothetical protein
MLLIQLHNVPHGRRAQDRVPLMPWLMYAVSPEVKQHHLEGEDIKYFMYHPLRARNWNLLKQYCAQFPELLALSTGTNLPM